MKENAFGAAGNVYAMPSQPAAAQDGKRLDASFASTPPAVVKDTTTATFAADVIQDSRKQPVLVDFWAPWCGPCKQLAPALEKVVKDAGGRVKLVKMNIDEHPSIAGQLGIQSIPAVIAFKDGQPVDGFAGALPESQIRAFVEKVAGKNGVLPQVAEALGAALEARKLGDLQAAADLYDAVLQTTPDSVEAIAGLADVLFETGDIAGAEEVLGLAQGEVAEQPALGAVRTRIALARQAERLGDPAEFERRLEVDPADHQARFDFAAILNAMGDRGGAADHLLAIMKADRAWNDDAARAQLLKLFEAWGMADEATLAARRKLSSLLFS